MADSCIDYTIEIEGDNIIYKLFEQLHSDNIPFYEPNENNDETHIYIEDEEGESIPDVAERAAIVLGVLRKHLETKYCITIDGTVNLGYDFESDSDIENSFYIEIKDGKGYIQEWETDTETPDDAQEEDLFEYLDEWEIDVADEEIDELYRKIINDK